MLFPLQISGALILCSVIQILLGLTGIMGVIVSYIGACVRVCVRACVRVCVGENMSEWNFVQNPSIQSQMSKGVCVSVRRACVCVCVGARVRVCACV